MELPLYVQRKAVEEFPDFALATDKFYAGGLLQQNNVTNSSRVSQIQNFVRLHDGDVDNIRTSAERVFIFRSRNRQVCGIFQMAQNWQSVSRFVAVPLAPSKDSWIRPAVIALFEHEIASFRRILSAPLRGGVTVGEYLVAVHRNLSFESPRFFSIYKALGEKRINVLDVTDGARIGSTILLDVAGNYVEDVVNKAIPSDTLTFPMFTATIDKAEVGTRDRLDALRVIHTAIRGA